MASIEQKVIEVDVSSITDIGMKSGRRPSTMATIEDDDERLLNQIGYTQVREPYNTIEGARLSRLVGSKSSFHKMVDVVLCHLCARGFGISPGNIWKSIKPWRTCSFSMGMVNRISDGFVYICFRFAISLRPTFLTLMMAVAELVSAYPTAGGMYFVTKNVVPPEHAAIWSWIIGWCNLLGQTAGVASVAYTVAQMILATASMNSAFDGTSYAFSP